MINSKLRKHTKWIVITEIDCALYAASAVGVLVKLVNYIGAKSFRNVAIKNIKISLFNWIAANKRAKQ